MDNLASSTIKEFWEKEKNGIQIIEPHNHHVNTAKCAIQTFKNHLIAGLCDIHRNNIR